jgi:16S rRNA (cytidine1402-2'-O)-methyltransferase
VLSPSNKGILYLVHTPIGNLGDLSPRVHSALEESDLILCEDTRTARKLLSHLRISKKRLLSFFEHNEESRIPEVLRCLKAGKRVSLLSEAGAPLLQDPGLKLVRKVVEKNLPFTVIPGPTAVIQALLLSGFDPVPFAFFGFIPRKNPARAKFLESVSLWKGTAILFLSPHRLIQELDFLAGSAGERPCVLAREMTKIHEEVIRIPTLREFREHLPQTIRGEWTAVLGPSPSEEGNARKPPFLPAEIPILEGKSLRAQAEELSRRTGIPFRKCYKELLALKRKRDDSSP